MNETRTDETELRSIDPARFGRTRLSEAPAKRSATETIGALATLLALVVGVPVLLLVLAGPPPIPGGAPSLKAFAQQLSFEDLVSVLVGVVWLAWLYFMVCLVFEVVATRRGRVARSLPLAGPVQRLARVLIGAVILTGLVAGPAQAAEAGSVAQRSDFVASATFVAPMQDAATTATGQVSVADAAATAQTAADSAGTEADSLVGKRVYTVKAPKNGYHDNLWDIAEKHLGDGRRYTEIYELNKDRTQPDHGHLELARLIQPGWDFVMPDDAVGVNRVTAPAPASTTTATAETALDSVAVDQAATAGQVADQVVDQKSMWSAGLGLLAAGILGALALQRRRRLGRRPDDEAMDVEADLLIAASLSRSSWVDQALRRLARECGEAGVVPPPAYAAIVGDDTIDLLLAPAVPTAIDGWTSLDDGVCWRHERGDDVGETEFGAVPYPALVSLGLDDEGNDVMLDLETAGGIVSIGGDPLAATEVAAALAIQCATSPWATDVQITASDLPDALVGIGDDRIRIVNDLGSELDRFEAELGGLQQDVLTGRMSRRGHVISQLVVVGQQPTESISERLGALVGAGRQAFSVVIAGEHPAARWRLSVDENGALSAPQLDLTVSAYRIAEQQVDAVAELFSAAREDEPGDDTDRVAISAPVRDHDDVVWSTATRRVGVLGDVGVQGGADKLSAERAEQVTELVVYLALHPEGVHPNVLAGVVWPRGVTADVRDAAIERARGWLGSDVDGSHFLRRDASGRLSLAPEVACDWDVARTLLIRSRRAADPRQEADALRRALGLVRGEVFSSVPEGRYGWIARDDTPRTMVRVFVDAAQRLCDLNDDDPGAVAWAAEVGLRVSPGNQQLWRDLVRARYEEDGPAGVHRTLDQMSGVLRGVALEAETEALIEELLPDTGSLPSSG